MNFNKIDIDVSKRLYNYMKQRFNTAEEETSELNMWQKHSRRCKQSQTRMAYGAVLLLHLVLIQAHLVGFALIKKPQEPISEKM